MLQEQPNEAPQFVPQEPLVTFCRRSYLFNSADSGGERAAAMYSIIGRAKLNGTAPEPGLYHVSATIADQTINRVNELASRHFVKKSAAIRPVS